MNIRILYVPIGVGTYHMETAGAAFDASAALLQKLRTKLDFGLDQPEAPLLTTDAVKAFMAGKTPDLVILQNITFANAAYISEVLRVYNGPIVLWTLREPVSETGGRLKLNSLTGSFSAANTYHQLRDDEPIRLFGSADEAEVEERLKKIIRALCAVKELGNLRLAQIGHTPQGFGFGRGLDAEMLKVFGTELVSVEARELIRKAESYAYEDCQFFEAEAKERIVGLEQMPEKNVRDFIRLYRAYQEFVVEQRIGALSSRCWPDFFVEYGTPVCSVLSILNALGIPSACEADTYGALSMAVGTFLTGEACFFGDPVALSEEENTLTFWHCGMAACSLAREDTGACVGVHPNRKIGPTMEFGAKAAKEVTILRIGKDRDGSFRLFASSGSCPDKPRQYLGTSMVVETSIPVRALVDHLLQDGFEPHYAVAYGDITEELKLVAGLLHIPFAEYRS